MLLRGREGCTLEDMPGLALLRPLQRFCWGAAMELWPGGSGPAWRGAPLFEVSPAREVRGFQEPRDVRGSEDRHWTAVLMGLWGGAGAAVPRCTAGGLSRGAAAPGDCAWLATTPLNAHWVNLIT